VAKIKGFDPAVEMMFDFSADACRPGC